LRRLGTRYFNEIRLRRFQIDRWRSVSGSQKI
jgi:hypothetical protein